MKDINSLLDIMSRLRDPQSGCPWDRAQTFDSLAPHTLEEAFEAVDCIERGDLEALPAELGDLLFQVVFYAQVAREAQLFSFADVVESITDKLVRRHPHVFGALEVADAEEQSERWETLKAAERDRRGSASELDDVPLALPALVRATKLQKRAARVGFDWAGPAEVKQKVDEEIAELTTAIAAADSEGIAEEFGDLLFAAVNWARHYGIDAERALRGASRKFERRFRYVERTIKDRGGDVTATSLDEMERLWRDAKQIERDKKRRVPKHP